MESIQNFTVPSAPVQTAERKPMNSGSTEDRKAGFRQMLESKQEERPDSEQLQMEEPKQSDGKHPELEQLAAMQMLSFQPVIIPAQPETVKQSCNGAEILQMNGQGNAADVQSAEIMQISPAVSENVPIGQEHSEKKASVFAGLGQETAQELSSVKESAAMLKQEISGKSNTAMPTGNAEQKVQDGNQISSVQDMAVQGSAWQVNSAQQMQGSNQSGNSSDLMDAAMQQPQLAEQSEKLPQEQGASLMQQPTLQNETAVKVSETPEAERKTSVQTPEKQVLQQVETLMKSGDRKITMQLEPHNLGKIRIELVQKENGMLHVVLHAEHKEVQKLLEQHLPEMQQLLRSDSHQEVQIQVPVQQEHEQQELYDQQQSSRQHQQNPEQQHKQEHKQDFLHQLRLGLFSEEA